MIDSIIRRLSGKRILVAGFGREGKSTLAFLNEFLPDACIAVADKNESALQSLDNKRYKLYFGDDYLDFSSDYDIIIKTPGISVENVDIERSKISSQTDLFLEAFDNQVVGVTGTKGKSTTSSLIYHLLKSLGKDVILAGNIGVPIFDCIKNINKNTIIVYELSAHQLQFIRKSPRVGVLLNIFEEHLDHFLTLENYENAKINILRYMNDNDVAIVNEPLTSKADSMNVRYVNFGGLKLDDYQLKWNEMPLQGEHNILNIKAALCACQNFGISLPEMLPHLATFQPLEHRQEFVGVFGGLKFYNDSISTIPQAAIAALKTIQNVDFLLLGGYDRGIDYSSLALFLKENPVANVLICGDAGESINKCLQDVDYKGVVIRYKDMSHAFEIIRSHAKTNDVCLLSPAAASYDQYVNFEERGRIFKDFAKKFVL